MDKPKAPTWFGRFRIYPVSCLLHLGQGAAAGVLLAYGHEVMALVWLACYIAYQGLSPLRGK